jgi:hypothetical protein
VYSFLHEVKPIATTTAERNSNFLI